MRLTTAILALVVALTASPNAVTAQPDSDAPFPSLMIPVHPGYYMQATSHTQVLSCSPSTQADDCLPIGSVVKGDTLKVAKGQIISNIADKDTPDQVEYVKVEYRQDIRKQGGKWVSEAWIPRYVPASSGHFYSCKEGQEDMWGTICTADQAKEKHPLKLFTATDDMSDGEAWRTVAITSRTPLPLLEKPDGAKTRWSVKQHDHAVIVLRDSVVKSGRTWWLVSRQVDGEVQLGWIADQLKAGSKWPTFRNSKEETEYFDIPWDRINAARDLRRR